MSYMKQHLETLEDQALTNEDFDTLSIPKVEQTKTYNYHGELRSISKSLESIAKSLEKLSKSETALVPR